MEPNMQQMASCIIYNSNNNTYVTVLEKRDHLATNIIFELCILSENGYCELQNGL